MDTSFTMAAVWIALSFGVGAMGCSGDMSNSSEVEALRVLAIRSDPPELRWPSGGEWVQATLSVLIAGSEEEISYHWGLCLLPGNLAEGDICYDDTLYVPLGEISTALMAMPSLESILEDNPELGSLPIDFDEGLDVRIQLSVSDGQENIDAFKDIRVSHEETPNLNPLLTGLRFGEEELEEGEQPWIPAAQEVVLEPSWSSDSIQMTGEDGEQEVLMISWFSDSGVFKKERSTETVPENTWTAPILEDGESEKEVLIWVVLRDDRGGVDWLSRSVWVGGEE